MGAADADATGLPANLQTIIDAIGFADWQSIEDDNERAIFQACALEGECMCCRKPLGTTTSLVLTHAGIVMAFCSGVCLTDMAVIGWLQEQHDDITSTVKFRGLDAR